jgi:hypothetical protein
MSQNGGFLGFYGDIADDLERRSAATYGKVANAFYL